jgi:predicted aspartyl protease
MQSMRLLTSLLLVLLMGAQVGVASPLDDAQAAYQQGQFVRAYQMFQPLADLGIAEAQYSLGVMSENGWGVPQDYAEALRWFRKAADQGNTLAQYNLAFMHKKGWGVPQDYAEALRWFRKAADQGYDYAQFDLGLMYANSEGIARDYVHAYMWFNLSAAKGNQSAAQYRELIAGQMSDVQIAEAQKLTREYVPNARQNRSASSSGLSAKRTTSRVGVALNKNGGTFVVPVEINGAITLNFRVDSGAADVSVPADVFSTLVRTGTIKKSDILGPQTYVLANGSKYESITFTIRSLKVGDKVVENVRGGAAPSQGELLLGQSFLEHFRAWSIDNEKGELVLEPK